MARQYGVKERTRVISAQVSTPTHLELLRRARERDTTISAEIRACINESLERRRWKEQT